MCDKFLNSCYIYKEYFSDTSLTLLQVSHDIPQICPGCDSNNRIRLHASFHYMSCLRECVSV